MNRLLLVIFFIVIGISFGYGQIDFYNDYIESRNIARQEDKPVFVITVEEDCQECDEIINAINSNPVLLNLHKEKLINILMTREKNVDYIEENEITEYPDIAYISYNSLIENSDFDDFSSEELTVAAIKSINVQSYGAFAFEELKSLITSDEIYSKIIEIGQFKEGEDYSISLEKASNLSAVHEKTVLQYFGTLLPLEGVEYIFKNPLNDDLTQDVNILDQMALLYFSKSLDIYKSWEGMQSIGYRQEKKIKSFLAALKFYLIDKLPEDKRYVAGSQLIKYHINCTDKKLVLFAFADVVKYVKDDNYYESVMRNINDTDETEWSYVMHDIYGSCAMKLGDETTAVYHIAKANELADIKDEYRATVSKLRKYF